MSVEITCGKCGEKITNMKMLKSLKDVLKSSNGKCPSCGQKLSTSESFHLMFKKINPKKDL
jgi:glycyl-tRNA synthetase (class II)